MYLPFMDSCSEKDIITEMNEYIIQRKYTTSFADLVPFIVANALKVTIYVLNHVSDDINVCTTSVIDGARTRSLVVLKTGEHYDAVILSPSHGAFLESNNASPVVSKLVTSNIRNSDVAPSELLTPCHDSIDSSDNARHMKLDPKEACIKNLKSFRVENSKKLIVYHLNINHFRNKFVDICNILEGNLADIFFISETKLDASFPIPQFNVDGFRCIRADRNANGGGILVYIRSDIAFRRRTDIESIVSTPVESIVLEVAVRKEKWLMACLYNPNNKTKRECCSSIESGRIRTRIILFSLYSR